MNTLEVTSISSKGQVVIPKDIRDELGIKIGTKLLVFTDGDNLLLKPIEKPKVETFKKLIKESRAFIKKSKLKKSDLEKTIKNVRNARSH